MITIIVAPQGLYELLPFKNTTGKVWITALTLLTGLSAFCYWINEKAVENRKKLKAFTNKVSRWFTSKIRKCLLSLLVDYI